MLIVAFENDILGQSYTISVRILTSREYEIFPQAEPALNKAGKLPTSYDLSSEMPPPGNQGKQGSCTSWAVAYAVKSYQEAKEEGWSYYSTGGRVNYNHLFSPSFIHNQLTARTNQKGLSFPAALNFVQNNGCSTLADMPYNEYDNQTQPTSAVKARAKKYKIKSYYRLGTHGNISIEDVKYRLTQGYPVLFACKVDEGFDSNCRYPNIWTGYWGRNIGSHAMVVVGYDDKHSAFKVLNSYGTSWGHNGYCWINYNQFKNVTIEAYITYDDKNSVYVEEIRDNTDTGTKTKTYSFGIYEGETKSGYPEGQGIMRYTRRVQIAKHDRDRNLRVIIRYAEAGDYFDGSWGNGDIVSGLLYDKDGYVKELINAPKRFNVYDISKD